MVEMSSITSLMECIAKHCIHVTTLSFNSTVGIEDRHGQVLLLELPPFHNNNNNNTHTTTASSTLSSSSSSSSSSSRQKKKWSKNKKKKKKEKRIIGVLGCMAERLKDDMFTKGTVDLIAGPDAYRDLPRLISLLLPPPPPPSPPPPLSSIDKKQQNYGTNNNSHEQHQTNNNDFEEEEGEYTLPKTASNVQLSLDETYAEITPVRHNPNDVSAFVSIMRGCNNMCSYCVVPFTRGRERSREFDSIVHETQHLVEVEHVKEVILLGQNVNSYHDRCQGAILATTASSSSSSSGGGGGVSTTGYYQTSNPGFTNLYKKRGGSGYYFADLVHAISNISPELRVRFTSPHPKDYPPELLHLMAETNNVCNQIHLPAQSGSNTVLERMRRGYTREAYLTLVDDVKRIIGNEDDDDDYVAFSSDFITGFCHETEEEHEDTIKLMQEVKYDQAYMFAYSMREKTNAHRTMVDDVPSDVKQRRLQEVISVFRTNVQERNEMLEVGRLRLVLVEGEARRKKKNDSEVVGRMWSGRTDQNKRVVFPSLLLNDDDDDDDDDFGWCFTEEEVKPLLSYWRTNNYDNAEPSSPSSLAREINHQLRPKTKVKLQPGDYVVVHITEARGHTLRGRALWRSTLSGFTELMMMNGGGMWKGRGRRGGGESTDLMNFGKKEEDLEIVSRLYQQVDLVNTL